MQISPTCSVVLPVHNEAETIYPLLAEIVAVFDSVARQSYEIIIVDDGSNDRSIAEIGRFKAAPPQPAPEKSFLTEIAVIVQPVRGGQAQAIMRGLRAARGELIVTMDSDGQYDPADIPRLLAKVESCDMVCGMRTSRRDGIARLLVSRLANGFRNLVTGDSLHDGGCTFRILRRKCLAAILPLDGRLNGCDFFFHPLFARKAGFIVREEPVAHRPRAGGRTNYRLMRGRFGSGLIACFKARKLVSASHRGGFVSDDQ